MVCEVVQLHYDIYDCVMFMNNWFDDGTGSRFMPDEIYKDQYTHNLKEERNIDED